MTGPADSPYADSGAGSVASIGPRFLAFVVDGVLADVIAIIVRGGYHPGGTQAWINYAAFLLIELLFVSVAGQTPGMKLLGVIVVKVDDRRRQKPQWILVRTLLLATIMPAVIVDEDGRAMHDRAAGTVMLRTR